MDKTTKQIRLQGRIKEMAASTVMMHIGEDAYRSIKQRDEHPVFIGMLVAYEGPSTGQMERFDQHVAENDPKLVPIKWWSEAAVYELAYRMNLDSPRLTIGHDDESTRDEGDVLSGFIQPNPQQGNIPEAFGVAYVRSQQAKEGVQSGKLDVVSVEADVVLLVGQQNQVEVETVMKVDAIALGNSDDFAPGFQRASVEAVVAEFTATIQGEDTMEIEQMSTNQLLEHPKVMALIQQQNQTTYGEMKTERGRADEAEKRVTQLDGELTAAKVKVKAAGAALNRDRVATLINTELADVKLPEAQKVALTAKLKDTITVDDPEVSDDDLKAKVSGVVKAEVTYLEQLNKEMGIKPPEDGKGKGSKATDKTDGEGGKDGDGEGDDTDSFLSDNPTEEETQAASKK